MIRRPSWLTGDAISFWDRNAKHLIESEMLGEKDADSFAILCDIYRLLRASNPLIDSKEAIRYSAMTKQYITLAKQFGMLPRDRKKSKLEHEPELDELLDRKIGFNAKSPT
jgi:phage terminase small subunit